MKRLRPFLIVLAAAALLVAGALAVRRAVRPPAVVAPPPTPVEVLHPEVGVARIPVPYRGTLEGDEDVRLSFRVGGEVARIHVREGAVVGAGTLLIELDASELDARLAMARSELARARAQEAHWARELEVDDRLHAEGAVSRARLDATRLSHRSAQLAVEAAASAVSEVEARAGGARIRAPRSGVVNRLDAVEGEGVQPGQVVVSLGGGALRVRVEVLEGDRARGIGEGTPARIRVDGCEMEGAVVTRVGGAARPPFGSVRVYISADFPCLEARSTGTPVEVTFHLEGAPDARFLPLSAVDFRGGSPRVFRVGGDDRVEAVPVTLGALAGELQELFGPLSADDLVVVTGASNLRPGDRVRVVVRNEGGLP